MVKRPPAYYRRLADETRRLRAMDGSEMDKGPWEVGFSGIRNSFYVQSDDFRHDVRLYVSGDFVDERSARKYAEWLAEKLNSEVTK